MKEFFSIVIFIMGIIGVIVGLDEIDRSLRWKRYLDVIVWAIFTLSSAYLALKIVHLYIPNL